jgi:hypothetical protein
LRAFTWICGVRSTPRAPRAGRRFADRVPDADEQAYLDNLIGDARIRSRMGIPLIVKNG